MKLTQAIDSAADQTRRSRMAKRPRELPQESSPEPAIEIVADPVDSAKQAGLRYVNDAKPGIKRLGSAPTFRYVGFDGKPVRDKETLHRIRSLVIPPAWVDVWICPVENGHLQATGRDARGRKQSRYHPRWREVRDETKYTRMIAFGSVLPVLRERIEHDLLLPGLPREKVLAALVRLMETTFIRVGNTEYARTNHSYGLTTMRNKHAEVKGATVTFDFAGKSGVHHTIDVENRRLAKIVKSCQDLPGYDLFQYVDQAGERHTIDSSDVNEYLHEITGQHFTAKDFRTWAGSVLTAMMLREFAPYGSPSEAKKNVVEAIKSVAARLGNTPSVCRKCYVHPAVLDAYLGGAMFEGLKAEVKREVDRQIAALRDEEISLLNLLGQAA